MELPICKILQFKKNGHDTMTSFKIKLLIKT